MGHSSCLDQKKKIFKKKNMKNGDFLWRQVELTYPPTPEKFPPSEKARGFGQNFNDR